MKWQYVPLLYRALHYPSKSWSLAYTSSKQIGKYFNNERTLGFKQWVLSWIQFNKHYFLSSWVNTFAISTPHSSPLNSVHCCVSFCDHLTWNKKHYIIWRFYKKKPSSHDSWTQTWALAMHYKHNYNKKLLPKHCKNIRVKTAQLKFYIKEA